MSERIKYNERDTEIKKDRDGKVRVTMKSKNPELNGNHQIDFSAKDGDDARRKINQLMEEGA